MEFKDYYKILGVDGKATPKEIKSAYRALARKFHPDLNPGDKSAEKTFSEMNEAYEVLGDEEARKKYDELAEQVRTGQRPSQEQQRRYRPEDLEDLFAEEEEAASFFEQFTGRRRSQAGPRKGADIQAEVEITLGDAVAGSTRRLSLERQEACSACGGKGIQGQSFCSACRGRGQVIVPQTLDVKIPAGVTEASTIRLQGQGQPGSRGGPAGDLLLQIRLEPSPVYEVKGHDLHRELEVSIFIAILGGEVAFEGVRGNLSLKLPPDTQNGRIFRLREQGLPKTGGRPPGDLYVKVSLRIPTGLSPEQRERLKSLSEELEGGSGRART